MRPADRRLFVVEDEPERVGEIILVGKINKKQTTGKVVAIGNKVTEFSVGDRLIFTKSTDKIEYEGKTVHSIYINPNKIVKFV